jgi:peptide/nickel transport system substrate-binding protein
VDFRLLGPVTAHLDGEELALGGRKPRALLAMLLLRANSPVSRDVLIDGLWGDRPPVAADHSLDDYVSRLRRLVGPDRVQRSPPGYRLRVEPGEFDVERFECLVEAGSAALARGDAGQAAELLRSALAEWRGSALADLLDEPFAAAAARDLEERRLLAVELRLEAELARGGGRELVPELAALVREQPFRERPVAQLMLAQYRSGDAAAALDTFAQARRRFVEELGLDPSSSLRQLERRILVNDSSLLPANGQPSGRAEGRKRRSSRRIAVVGLAVAVVAAVAGSVVFGVAHHSRAGGRAAVDPQGLIALRADGRAGGNLVALDVSPAALLAAQGSLWVTDANDQVVLRVDPDAESVVDRVPLDGAPGALAAGGGSIWVATAQPGAVKRIDATSDDVTQTIPLGVNPSAIAYGADAVWVADPSDQSLIELDPGAGTVRTTVTLTTRPSSIAVGAGAVWVASYDDGTVTEVDPHAGVPVATIPAGEGPSALAVAAGSVWVANQLSGTVSRIDPETARVVATIATGSGPDALAVTRGSLWVANEFSRNVTRIDLRHGSTNAITTGGAATALAPLAGKIWVGTRSAVAHRGGALVLLSHGPFPSMDPEIEYEVFPPQLHGLAYDALVTFDHTGGSNGLRLVPDLALGLPSAADAGRTYVFRLRPRIRYADGRLLRAEDVRRAFERLYRVGSPITSFFGDIVGTSGCSTTRCDLALGVVADDRLRTVVFHLTRPDPEFLYKLAFVFTAPVPAGTPWHELHTKPFPGTGPYQIARATSTEVVLVRNRYFHEWSHAAQPDGRPDRIVWHFGQSRASEVRAIEAGRADWMFDKVPAGRLREVATRYASEFHSNAAPETDFFMIDTRIRPFDDVRVRRAVNLAIDRRRIASFYGGAVAATPTCQVLPPGIPGYSRYCPYTRGAGPSGAWRAPDLIRARRLIAAAGARGAHVEVWGFSDDPSIPPAVVDYVGTVLRGLGFRVHVGWTTHAGYDQLPRHVRRKIQLLPNAWFADYPAPSDFFDVFIACKGTYNNGRFCDRTLDRSMQRASSLEATDPRRASADWSRVDRRTVDEAAWIPLVNTRIFDLVSRRVQNYQHNPMWGFLADQVWLR